MRSSLTTHRLWYMRDPLDHWHTLYLSQLEDHVHLVWLPLTFFESASHRHTHLFNILVSNNSPFILPLFSTYRNEMVSYCSPVMLLTVSEVFVNTYRSTHIGKHTDIFAELKQTHSFYLSDPRPRARRVSTGHHPGGPAGQFPSDASCSHAEALEAVHVQ